MENSNSTKQLNEIVKELLNSDFETYTEDDWLKIQPKISSASSPLNTLGNFDFEAIIKQQFKENKTTLVYIGIALFIILTVVGIVKNSDNYSEYNNTEINTPPTQNINKNLDTIRGADTLKTIGTTYKYAKTITDSSSILTPKTTTLSPQVVTSDEKITKETERKTDSVREKAEQKITKKKSDEDSNKIEEIVAPAPKPTINVIKKKKTKDSLENIDSKPTQAPTPKTVEQNNITPLSENNTTPSDNNKEAEDSDKKKRNKKRNKKEITPDDQKPKTLEEVVE
jgi:hypothetical protein